MSDSAFIGKVEASDGQSRLEAVKDERDTALAMVKELTEALKVFHEAEDHYSGDGCPCDELIIKAEALARFKGGM